MFEFTRNFYEAAGNDSGSEPIGPGTVIIPEQTVTTISKSQTDIPNEMIYADIAVVPDKLLIEFDGVEYIVEKKTALNPNIAYYGELVDDKPGFNTYPFFVDVENTKWYLYTGSEGTYTISAKIPEEKSSKVLSFPKGRTIVSELSRLNKAFGSISKKKTIIGQLSDIADAAEAGKIGGGGLFVVSTKVRMVDGEMVFENASKNASEIVDAANNNQLPVLFVYSEPDDATVMAFYSESVYHEGHLESAKFVSINGQITLFVGIENTITIVS